MIQFEDVTRNYGEKIAVSHLNLEVPGGQLFAFLGPNGAGKTTTIRMIVGLLRPTSGTVRVCGHDVVRETRLANSLLGYVPDVPYLYDKLTGREFLEFIADMYALGKRESREKIDAQINYFDLGDFVDDLTESYSHGMRQRLTFAAALLHDPAVLVVDEPIVGLDPRSVRLVKDMLASKAAGGMTIFMSTHLLSIAEEIADKVGIVDQGHLRFLGTVGQLKADMRAEHATLEEVYLGFTAPDGLSGNSRTVPTGSRGAPK